MALAFRRLVAFSLCALACGGAVSAVGAAAADPRLRAGIFLYAAPSLGDPNFSETVVLLVQHGSQGAMGLIVNRPTETTAAEAMPGTALPGLRVYRGGPVQSEAILVLLRGKRAPDSALRVIDGVFMSGRPKDLEAAARGGPAVDRVRLYAGYAGWGAGQLEQEIRLGGWVIGPADAEAVFAREPEALWRKVWQLMQRREARLRPPLRTSGELQREVARDAAEVGFGRQQRAAVVDRRRRDLRVDQGVHARSRSFL